jgi:hypothetical protein
MRSRAVSAMRLPTQARIRTTSPSRSITPQMSASSRRSVRSAIESSTWSTSRTDSSCCTTSRMAAASAPAASSSFVGGVRGGGERQPGARLAQQRAGAPVDAQPGVPAQRDGAVADRHHPALFDHGGAPGGPGDRQAREAGARAREPRPALLGPRADSDRRAEQQRCAGDHRVRGRRQVGGHAGQQPGQTVPGSSTAESTLAVTARAGPTVVMLPPLGYVAISDLRVRRSAMRRYASGTSASATVSEATTVGSTRAGAHEPRERVPVTHEVAHREAQGELVGERAGHGERPRRARRHTDRDHRAAAAHQGERRVEARRCADRVDDPVGPSPVGHTVHERAGAVGRGRQRPLAGGEGPPGLDRLDQHDDPGPAGLRDEAGELADRAAADDRHRVPRLQVRAAHGGVAGGQGVAEEHGGVQRDPRRYGAQHGVGVGHAHELGLRARERRPERFAGAEEAAFGALPVIATATPPAGAARGVVRSDDERARPVDPHVGADLGDLADELVPEHRAARHVLRVGDDVQVGAADRGRRTRTTASVGSTTSGSPTRPTRTAPSPTYNTASIAAVPMRRRRAARAARGCGRRRRAGRRARRGAGRARRSRAPRNAPAERVGRRRRR